MVFLAFCLYRLNRKPVSQHVPTAAATPSEAPSGPLLRPVSAEITLSFQRQRVPTGVIDALAAQLKEADTSDRQRLLAEFKSVAMYLPIAFDENYGAVVLEHLASEQPDRDVAVEYLTLAVHLASWCAAQSTSGGEGTARMSIVRGIEERLHRLKALPL